jgi:glycerophosphoryl diester phosphodiesterase
LPLKSLINLGPNIRLIVLNHKKTEIHGHRGCRGYFPENTLIGFKHALELQVDAIELDVVMSKDLEVVVSHEYFMHHKKCLKPNLKAISKEEETSLFLYQMNYEQIKTFDCGLLAHPEYPLLKICAAYKPLLNEVIEAVNQACKNAGKASPIYNIEIKSEPLLIGKSQPDYELFVNTVLKVISNFSLEGQVIIQSFDKEILRSIKRINERINLSLLIEDDKNPFKHIEELGFKPDILASDYIFLNETNASKLQAEQIKVFAFTVNQINDIQRMLDFGVDAIITDYPDVAAKVESFYKYPEK